MRQRWQWQFSDLFSVRLGGMEQIEMSIIRTKKDQKYFIASNALFNDKNLSWEARGIMGYLLSKPDGWQCHNFDLVNQGPAGKHIIQRVLKELKEAGYIHRYQESDGHKIEWVTEVYETPELNTASRNTEIPQAENPTGGYSAGRESGDIVSTDSINNLPTVRTDKTPSAKADYSRPVSLLSEKEVRNLTLTLADWKQYLSDEQAERQRKGVIAFLEGKIRYGQLRPVNEDELKLFEILAIEYDADGGKTPPNKFPCLETKRLFNEAAQFHNGTLEGIIKKAIHKRGKGIAKIVDYISSPKWKESNGQSSIRNSQPEANEAAPEESRADAYLRRNQTNIDAWEAKMFG
jgi:hypothetical protein